MKTNAALVASEIRKELKNTFPGVAFSVTAKYYSGGSSVRVIYKNGPTVDRVEKIAKKFQRGHFDSSIDLYVYSNSDKSLPQVNYVFIDREYTEDEIEMARERLGAYWGVDFNDEHAVLIKTGGYPLAKVCQELSKIDYMDKN